MATRNWETIKEYEDIFLNITTDWQNHHQPRACPQCVQTYNGKQHERCAMHLPRRQ